MPDSITFPVKSPIELRQVEGDYIETVANERLDLTLDDVAKALGISRSTIYRRLAERKKGIAK